MSLSFERVTEIARSAYTHLSGFLTEDLLGFGQFYVEWKAARDEAAKYGFNPTGDLFLFLDWLEDTQKKAEFPWVRRKNDHLFLSNSSSCCCFLRSLLDNLNSLIEPSRVDPGTKESAKIQRCGNQPSPLLQRFGQFSAGKVHCILSYNELSLPWQDYPGFVSWLIVCKGNADELNELHIATNEERITCSSGEVPTQAKRFEKAYLHELGHAVTNLDHYFTATPINGVIYAPAEHETEAWLYAHGVKSLVSSIRARLSRLLYLGDGEWQ